MPKEFIPEIKASKGVLHPKKSQPHYQLKQYQPCDSLEPFIEQYWHVTWDLAKQTSHTQQNLPQPNIHFTFEREGSFFYGPVKSRFSRILMGKDEIFGIKFNLGALQVITQKPLSEFVDVVLDLNQFLNIDQQLENLTLDKSDCIEKKITAVENYFQRLLFDDRSPAYIKDLAKVTKLIKQVQTITALIENNHSITKVSQLVELSDLSERALQRLFKKHIGLSPKWLIRKYRIHELLTRLESTQILTPDDWQKTIHDLEYVDQAHFIKEFKSFVGCTPQQYSALNFD